MHFTGRTWRPPYETYSVILEANSGCTWNRCKFCSLYKDEPFRMTPMEISEEDPAEIKAAQPHARRLPFNSCRCGRAIRMEGYGLFLTGANPFALSFGNLYLRARTVRDYLIKCDTMAMFAGIRDIKSKTVEELRRLGAAGVNGLTIGMESADDETLASVNKGYTSADILEQCCKLDQAGIEYYFIYMTGLAGAGNGTRNAVNSAKIINQLNPWFLGIDSLTLFPDTELYGLAQEGKFTPASERERLQELVTLLEHLQITVRLQADTKSNFLPLNGTLPRMTGQFIAQLNHALDTTSEEEMAAYRSSLDSL